MRLGACTETQCLDFALVHMDGAALRWAEGQVFENWESFVAGFYDRFCQADEDVIIQHLQQLRQGPDQNVEQLADTICTLCSQVTQVTSNQMRNYFIRALHPTIRQHVVALMPVDLTAAEAIAKNLERFEKQTNLAMRTANTDKEASPITRTTDHVAPSGNTVIRGPPRPSVEDLVDGLEKLRLELAQVKEVAQKKESYRPRGPIRCRNCGEEGHVVRECPRNRQPLPINNDNRPPVQAGSSRQANRNLNLAQFYEDEDMYMSSENLLQEAMNKSEIQQSLEEAGGDPQYSTRRIRGPEGDDEEERQRKKRPPVVEAWDPRDIRQGVPEFQPREPIRRPPGGRMPNISPISGIYHIVEQLKATKANASMWTYLQDSHRARQELLNALKTQMNESPISSSPADNNQPSGPEPMWHIPEPSRKVNHPYSILW